MKPAANPAEDYMSTASVAAALGVSVTTVKRWVDDGILPAHRTAGGHRKLLRADVIRLTHEGNLPQVDMSRLSARPVHGSIDRVAERLAEAMIAGNGVQVRGLLHGAYYSGTAMETLADRVISPALARVGHEWSVGVIDVMHEHRGTQLVAAAIYELKSKLERHAEKSRPIAVGGAIERDHYVLPTLLAQSSLEDVGWNAINLGPNTPFPSFRKALGEWQPKLVWISVSYLANSAEFENEYQEFFADAKHRGIAVALGGRGLGEELRGRLPYTTFGDGLTHLVEFARTLNPRPKPPRRGRPPGRTDIG